MPGGLEPPEKGLLKKPNQNPKILKLKRKNAGKTSHKDQKIAKNAFFLPGQHAPGLFSGFSNYIENFLAPETSCIFVSRVQIPQLTVFLHEKVPERNHQIGANRGFCTLETLF